MKIHQNSAFVEITEANNTSFQSETPVALVATEGKIGATLQDACYDLHDVSEELHGDLSERLKHGELSGTLFHQTDRLRLFYFRVCFES